MAEPTIRRVSEPSKLLSEEEAAMALRRDLPADLVELVESERKYRLLIETVNDGIVISQSDHFIFFNGRFAEMLGYEPAELKELTYLQIYTDRGLAILRRRGEARQHGQIVPPLYETEFRRKDGRILHVEANVSIIDYQGRLATFAIIRDITEIKRSEHVQAAFTRLGLGLSRAKTLEQVGQLAREASEALFTWDALYLSCRRSGRTRFYTLVKIDTVDGVKTEFDPSEWDLLPTAFVNRLVPGQPLLINRSVSDPETSRLVSFGAKERRSRSLLFAPMYSGSSLLGVITVQSYQENHYEERDAELLQRLADAIRPTVERLLAERRTQAFLELASRLTTSISPGEAARIVVQAADQLVGWDASFVDLYYPETGRVEPLLNIDFVDGQRRDVASVYTYLEPGLLQRRLLTEGPFLLFRGEQISHYFDLQPFGDTVRPSESMIFVPIRGREGVIGFLSIQSYTVRAYDEEDIRIVEALANHCSGALDRTRAEGQLRRSEERYRTVVETVETVIVGYLADRTIVEWNRQSEHLYGYTRDEAIGRDYFDLFVPSDERQRVLAAFERSLATRPGGNFENAILTRSGERRILLWNSTHLRDDEGRVIGLLCCGQDVTERKRWEEELRRSEEQYRAIVEDQTELICRLTPDGLLTFANEAYCDYYGRARGKLIGINCFEMISPEDRAFVLDQLAQLTPGNPFINLEQRVILPTGEVRWQEWTDRAIFDADGKLLGYQAAGRDVTRLREAQEALRRSQERYLRLLESSSDVIFQLSTEGEVIYVNHACQEVFGVDPEAFGESPNLLPTLIHPEDRERQRADWEDFRRTGRFPERTEPSRWLRPDGRIIHTENRISNLYGPEGSVEGILAVCRDVTSRVQYEHERRALEEQITQAQKLESMSVLAGGIAHDFNNLLTGILGNAGLVLADLDPDSPAAENVIHLQTAALRASELTKQMLAYAGKGTFVVQPINLSGIVREMTGLLKTVLSPRATLSMDLALEMPFVQADATQIRQVVMNIITNASDALEGREGLITLHTGVRHFTPEDLLPALFGKNLPADEYVYLAVTDNGCGMDAATKARIFDPFFTKKPTGLVGGRGLGLAAVLGIVRNHRGAIDVDSEEGRGTTFTVILPKSSYTESASPVPIPRRIERELTLRHGTVLVADDEEVVRRVAKGTLTKVGYEVVQAADGIEALHLIESLGDKLSIVLIDLRMPRMDGRELYEHLCAKHPSLPVILMSGYAEKEVSENFTGKHPMLFVEKPFSPHDLIAAIDRLVGGQRGG